MECRIRVTLIKSLMTDLKVLQVSGGGEMEKQEEKSEEHGSSACGVETRGGQTSPMISWLTNITSHRMGRLSWAPRLLGACSLVPQPLLANTTNFTPLSKNS